MEIKYKLKKENFFMMLFFLFLPTPIFFIKIIQCFLKKKLEKFDCLLISLYMSILGFLVSPLGDLYRHSEKYWDLKNQSFEMFIEFIKSETDYFLNFITYIFSKLGISIQYIQLYAIFFCYYSSFIILLEITKDKNKYLRNISFLIMFFLIEFFVISVGIRSGLAAHIFIYALYQRYIRKNNSMSIFLFVLSSIIHFYIFPLIMMIILSKFINLKMAKRILIISIIFLFMGEQLIKKIFENIFLGEALQVKINAYIYGYWARDFLKDFSIKYKISLILKNYVYFPIIFYFIVDKNSEKNNIKKLFFLVASMTNVFYYFVDVFGRYAYVCRILGIIILIMEIKQQSNKKNYFLKCIFILSFITWISNIYSSKVNIINNYQYKLLYKPLPLILTTDYYNKKWLECNVNPDGGVK